MYSLKGVFEAQMLIHVQRTLASTKAGHYLKIKKTYATHNIQQTVDKL